MDILHNDPFLKVIRLISTTGYKTLTLTPYNTIYIKDLFLLSALKNTAISKKYNELYKISLIMNLVPINIFHGQKN